MGVSLLFLCVGELAVTFFLLLYLQNLCGESLMKLLSEVPLNRFLASSTFFFNCFVSKLMFTFSSKYVRCLFLFLNLLIFRFMWIISPREYSIHYSIHSTISWTEIPCDTSTLQSSVLKWLLTKTKSSKELDVLCTRVGSLTICTSSKVNRI